MAAIHLDVRAPFMFVLLMSGCLCCVCAQKTGATRRPVDLAEFACLMLTDSEVASVSSAASMAGNNLCKQINQ